MFSPETRILLVDDVEVLRKLTRKLLIEMGLVRVTEASDGEEAWSKIQESVQTRLPYELILSDCNMPKMKGTELLVKVRKLPELANVPFVLLSADSEQGHSQLLETAKNTQWVSKPFTRELLLSKLKAIHSISQQSKKAA